MPNTTTIAAIASSINGFLRDRPQYSNQGPVCTVKGLRRAIEIRHAAEDFQQRGPSVAARQLKLSSCFGTTHFDLRRAQRGLSFAHRGRGRIS
jgi:hypothetical protein